MARTTPPSPNPRRVNKQPTEELVSGTTPVNVPRLPDADEYDDKTLAWWDMWSTSPQAQSFLPSDWQRLLFLAPLVDQYWLDPKASILAEIRLNEERLGATVRDRQSLRMEFKKPGKEQAPEEPTGDPENVVRLRRAFGSA